MMKITQITPPHGLEGKIIERIHRAERKTVLTRFIATGIVTIGSLAGIVPACIYFINDIKASGFYDYISLLVTDNAFLTTYGKDLMLSLAESLPLLALTLCLALVGIFLWSLSRATRNARMLMA